MNKSRLLLYLFYVPLGMGLLTLASSCASDDLAMGSEPKGGKMSLGIDVMQITEGTRTRAAAPAIKSYQMKTTNGKPVYVQCSSEAYIDRHQAKSGESQASRGVSITSDTFYDRFGLFYYQYDKNKSWADIVAGGSESPTVSNMAVEKSKGWLTDKYWPGRDHKLTFMAYAPYDNDYKNGSTKYIQLASTVNGYPTLTYTVPAKVEDQQDLLVSAEEATQDMEGDYNKVIGMKFYHTLSAINFKIGSTMAPGRIAKIEVKGVYNKGVYDFGSKEWSNQSGTANYAITPNYVVADQRGVVFTGVDASKNDLLLMMPQTAPTGAKIVVTIEDGANYSSKHEMELPIEGHEWLPGYTITYSLSTSQENSDYIFSVSKIASIDKAATTVKYNVSSYVQSYYGSQTPVGWKAKYAVDDQIEADEYSEELGDVVSGGFVFDMPTPTATTSALTTNITALEPPISDPSVNTHTATLRAASPKGTKNNPYDLSTLGGTRSQSTANCYIVQAPGWYQIPIVYGNCIKNGTNNTVVYGTSDAMANFVNHLDHKISDPWLVNNEDVSPSEGILVWQDAYNMIPADSVDITSDKKYLYFKVNEDYICQGNALLSVRDESKKILWSWHIWVTDENLSSATNVPITNHKNTVYNLMAVPLGHCNPDRRTYKPREIKFAFEQEETGMTADVSFSQATTSYQEYGLNVTYYQYGRSTPERLIGTGKANTFKTLYDGADYPVAAKNGAVTRGTAIQNPTIHYWTDRGNWCSKRLQWNFWDINCTTKGYYDKATAPSVKTIYDPCPVGYKVPEPEAFTGFTTTGNNSTSKATFNVSGTWNKGWNFYTEPNKQGSTYHVHAFNMIHFTSTKFHEGFETSVWIRTTGSTYDSTYDRGYHLRLTSSYVYPLTIARCCYGAPIYPESDD